MRLVSKGGEGLGALGPWELKTLGRLGLCSTFKRVMCCKSVTITLKASTPPHHLLKPSLPRYGCGTLHYTAVPYRTLYSIVRTVL